MEGKWCGLAHEESAGVEGVEEDTAVLNVLLSLWSARGGGCGRSLSIIAVINNRRASKTYQTP